MKLLKYHQGIQGSLLENEAGTSVEIRSPEVDGQGSSDTYDDVNVDVANAEDDVDIPGPVVLASSGAEA